MNLRFIFPLFFIIVIQVSAQQPQKVFVSDIDNYWIAYDSIQKVNEYAQKIRIINDLYISKGTKGLHAFMKAREYNDSLWVNLIEKYPKFWNSIRPNTLEVKKMVGEIEIAIAYLKQMYPQLKEAEMYFTIGGLRSGGTIDGNMSLVGCEIATGNSSTDVSEFKSNWLKDVFKNQSLDNIILVNVHEYIHTQQKGDGNERVLTQCIREGACDFITELVTKKPLRKNYILYGMKNAEQIKALFKKEMFTSDFTNWLYNGGQKAEGADLGYYVGYEICKSYYNNFSNKQQAIQDIIELNYEDTNAVENFLSKSGWYKEEINKRMLIEEYKKNQPDITGIDPFKNGDLNVSSEIKEIKINFSKEMQPSGYSFSYSDKGKSFYPDFKVKGYENDNQTLVLQVNLKPGKEYEFVITNNTFRSKDGYQFKHARYLIKFKTKPE